MEMEGSSLPGATSPRSICRRRSQRAGPDRLPDKGVSRPGRRHKLTRQECVAVALALAACVRININIQRKKDPDKKPPKQE